MLRRCEPFLLCALRGYTDHMRKLSPKIANLANEMIDYLGGNVWSKQQEVIDAVMRSPKRVTVVQSCTGAGKSYVAALLAWTWSILLDESLVVTTAPSQRQVLGAVWNEMRVIERRMKKQGVSLGIGLAPKNAEGSGKEGRRLTGYSTDNAVNFAGWHSPGGTLVIIDDAQGLDDATWDTILSTLTGPNDRVVAFANPLTPSGKFYDLCLKSEANNVIKISAFDCPNVVEGRTVIPGGISLEQLKMMRENYGEDSPVWKGRVLGEFPDSNGELSLIPLRWLENARNEHEAWALTLADETPEWTVLAADLAGLGVDRGVSAIVRDYDYRDDRGMPMRARVFDPLATHPKFEIENTMGTVGFLVDQVRRIKPNSFRVDKAGLGVGVYDRLRELKIPVVGMSGGRGAMLARYKNERAEVLHTFREALRPRSTDGGADDRPVVMMPWNDKLAHQASTLRMTFTSSGQHAVESKKEWSQRMSKQKSGTVSKSPDELDAAAMAICDEPKVEDDSGHAEFLRAYG